MYTFDGHRRIFCGPFGNEACCPYVHPSLLSANWQGFIRLIVGKPKPETLGEPGISVFLDFRGSKSKGEKLMMNIASCDALIFAE